MSNTPLARGAGESSKQSIVTFWHHRSAELLRPARYGQSHPRRPTNALFRSRGRNQRGIPHTEQSADDGEPATLPGLDTPLSPLNMAPGSGALPPGIRRGSNTVGSSARLEHRGARNPSCLGTQGCHSDLQQIVAPLSHGQNRIVCRANCGLLPKPFRPTRFRRRGFA